MYQYFGNLYAEEFRRPDNVAFYIHCKEPVSAELPDCLLRKRTQPTRQQLEMKQQLAAERRSLLEDRKNYKLSMHLARVSLIVDRHRRHTASRLLETQDRIKRDMNEHVQRRTELLDARLKRLSQHISNVGERCDLVRHEKFLKNLTSIYMASSSETSN
ncbi:uncharacterized protein LOC6592628 [Drosophila persimilis]|uniref:uncharacterized protein LOC6592628 n=1 Tax=Drosophila persimilis TaxID=7234 RepID=UPI000F087C11|nr:uncharacterized protein LOC6592628 [Drosophila persimilis]